MKRGPIQVPLCRWKRALLRGTSRCVVPIRLHRYRHILHACGSSFTATSVACPIYYVRDWTADNLEIEPAVSVLRVKKHLLGVPLLGELLNSKKKIVEALESPTWNNFRTPYQRFLIPQLTIEFHARFYKGRTFLPDFVLMACETYLMSFGIDFIFFCLFVDEFRVLLP